MKNLTLTGSPRAMGRAFGEACRDEIAEFYAIRRAHAFESALLHGDRVVEERELLALAQRCVAHTRRYHPEGLEELEGIAEGAGLTVAQVLAMNGLTDLRDALAWPGDPRDVDGCTAALYVGAQGVLCGQTWDLMTDNLPFMAFIERRPDRGPWTWSLTTVGCLSLVGMNSEGICVGNTNLRTHDNRDGVMYLSVIHKALSCVDLDAAIAAVTAAPRVGAHFFYLAARGGAAAAIECSARRSTVQRVARGAFVHTNHCLVPENAALETLEATSSTLVRLTRMRALLAAHPEVGVDAFRAALEDREGGADAICVDDCEGRNTNGAVVMAPDQGALWVCMGNPTPEGWSRVQTAR